MWVSRESVGRTSGERLVLCALPVHKFVTTDVLQGQTQVLFCGLAGTPSVSRSSRSGFPLALHTPQGSECANSHCLFRSFFSLCQCSFSASTERRRTTEQGELRLLWFIKRWPPMTSAEYASAHHARTAEYTFPMWIPRALSHPGD